MMAEVYQRAVEHANMFHKHSKAETVKVVDYLVNRDRYAGTDWEFSPVFLTVHYEYVTDRGATRKDFFSIDQEDLFGILEDAVKSLIDSRGR